MMMMLISCPGPSAVCLRIFQDFAGKSGIEPSNPYPKGVEVRASQLRYYQTKLDTCQFDAAIADMFTRSTQAPVTALEALSDVAHHTILSLARVTEARQLLQLKPDLKTLTPTS
jgi:hypothetical protein